MTSIIPFILSLSAFLINVSLIAKFVTNGNMVYLGISCFSLAGVFIAIYQSLHFFTESTEGKNIKQSLPALQKQNQMPEKLFSPEPTKPLAPIEPKAFAQLAKEIAQEENAVLESTNIVRPSEQEEEEDEDFVLSKPQEIPVEVLSTHDHAAPPQYSFKSFKKINTPSVLEALDGIIAELGPAKGKSRLIISQLPMTRGLTLMDFIKGVAVENQILCLGVAEKTSFIPHTGQLNSSAIQPIIQYLWAKKDNFDEVIFYCKEGTETIVKPIIDILNQRISYEQTMLKNQTLAEEMQL